MEANVTLHIAVEDQRAKMDILSENSRNEYPKAIYRALKVRGKKDLC
jgi:hypothetical protein